MLSHVPTCLFSKLFLIKILKFQTDDIKKQQQKTNLKYWKEQNCIAYLIKHAMGFDLIKYQLLHIILKNLHCFNLPNR